MTAMSMPSAKSEEQQPAPQERFKLRSVAFFGRTLDEYLQMFAFARAQRRCQGMGSG